MSAIRKNRHGLPVLNSLPSYDAYGRAAYVSRKFNTGGAVTYLCREARMSDYCPDPQPTVTFDVQEVVAETLVELVREARAPDAYTAAETLRPTYPEAGRSNSVNTRLGVSDTFELKGVRHLGNLVVDPRVKMYFAQKYPHRRFVGALGRTAVLISTNAPTRTGIVSGRAYTH